MTGNLTRNWQGWGPRVSLRQVLPLAWQLVEVRAGESGSGWPGLCGTWEGPGPRADAARFSPRRAQPEPRPRAASALTAASSASSGGAGAGAAASGCAAASGSGGPGPGTPTLRVTPSPMDVGGAWLPRHAWCTPKMLAVVGARVGVPFCHSRVQKWWGLEWDSG